ncbi:uncharacterized protein G2W53_027150 [Senna tora]|uniref:Uncharacterized protein n=1 Tax=Senna tora TaxID=362788 RepID=A0A834TIT4_9FABA|nr:uncharacterized protein G2W53_027150 [Senna tora]
MPGLPHARGRVVMPQSQGGPGAKRSDFPINRGPIFLLP